MNRDSLSVKILFLLLPVAASVAFSALLVILVGSDPIEVLNVVWGGAFSTTGTLAAVINFWIPLTLCALGLVITFTAGLWNIGVEGQMMLGAIFASWAAQYLVLPAEIQLVVQILLAMLGGMLWAGIVVFLKVKLGVHEIFGGVAFNFLATLFAQYLVAGPWRPPGDARGTSTAQFPASALYPKLSDDFPISVPLVIIVIVAFVAIVIALRGTRWGLQLKATGKNPRSALLLGVPTTRSSFSAMLVCGALAGIAGSYRVLFTYGSLRIFASGGIGFLAVLMALLVNARALFVPWVSFAFCAIVVGSSRLPINLQLDQSLSGVLQGMLVLLTLISNGIRTRLLDRHKPVAPPVTATVEIARHE